jgi:hypothetical protein
MKILFSVLLFLFVVDAHAGGIGNYSHGWRVGQITKFSVKGLLFKSGEGQMLMGRESTPYIIGHDDEKITVNPWYFSVSDKAVQRQLKDVMGDYAVLEYKQVRLKSPKVDTDYEIVGVSPVAEKLDKVCVAKDYNKGHKSESGTRVGRIVKASSKGTFVDSFELLLQQGNSGNQFKHMSISKDPALFECAVDYLKAGQKVKITYSESFFNMDIIGRETNYDIIKIEPIRGLD